MNAVSNVPDYSVIFNSWDFMAGPELPRVLCSLHAYYYFALLGMSTQGQTVMVAPAGGGTMQVAPASGGMMQAVPPGMMVRPETPQYENYKVDQVSNARCTANM